jgi:hypothetical protein
MVAFLSALAPLPCELLSSWIVRNSRANLLRKLHTYMNLLLPGHQVWTRDVDWFSDPLVVKAMADANQVSLERAQTTCLKSLEGIVFTSQTTAR